MKTSLSQRILEKIYPKLIERIRDLETLVNGTDDTYVLITARENILTLMSVYPANLRLKSLLRKVHLKIKLGK
jgi:hypothetical protein